MNIKIAKKHNNKEIIDLVKLIEILEINSLKKRKAKIRYEDLKKLSFFIKFFNIKYSDYSSNNT